MQFRTPSNAFFQSRPFLDAIPHPEQRPFFNQDPSLMQFRALINVLSSIKTRPSCHSASRTTPSFNQEHHCKKIPPYVTYLLQRMGDTRLILLFRFKMRSDPSDRSSAFLRHIRGQPPKSIQSKSALYQPVFTRPAATPLIVSRTSVTRSLGGLSLSRNF